MANDKPLTDAEVAEVLLQDNASTALSGNYHNREWDDLVDHECWKLIALVNFIRTVGAP